MAAEARGGGRNDDGAAFWRFSLVFYAEPGVAPALIALQDRAGCDVNIVLFALWLGVAKGRALDAAGLAAAEAAAAPVREAVVGELRALRRRLRSRPDLGIQSLRRRVQGLEIAAERIVQERLAAALGPGAAGSGDRVALAAANLAVALGPAADADEAAVVRRALGGFMRRV
jgi:uncharacterized protein (TIGR02444 family)